ncbi:MAG: methionyl-tRNA formyltransferase [Epulopiscium sp.]|nr:methionyl-tRNA formyltransferase [Candidatus Epulonipiscium sp.]
MKVVFMGTPEFAVPSLKKLIEEKYNIIAVVTQPDRPKGRGKKTLPPPVKQLALEENIPVFQPERVKDSEFIETMKSLSPDLIIVIAFGQILPKEILDMPRFGCINVHGSLLPKYRGAAPIQWSVINGEEVTGVTTMFMDEGMDTGDMLLKGETPISKEDTSGDLHDKMSIVGAEVLKDTLDQLIRGNLKREKQNSSEATYAPMLKKEMGLINWNEPSNKIVNLIRGLSPWPSAYTFYKEFMLKVWKAQNYNKTYENALPGEIVEIIKDKGLIVKTGDGSLLITEIQVPNGKRMAVREYLRGHDMDKNTILGTKF